MREVAGGMWLTRHEAGKWCGRRNEARAPRKGGDGRRNRQET